MILDGSKKSFTSALLDLELFGEISGLWLNSKKTEILWIVACTGRQDKLCPEKDLKWVTDKLKVLGVWISSNPMDSMEANYNEKLLKVRNCLSCWEYCGLSLLGKIIVLKSLITSQLVYILSPLTRQDNIKTRQLYLTRVAQSATRLVSLGALGSIRLTYTHLQ